MRYANEKELRKMDKMNLTAQRELYVELVEHNNAKIEKIQKALPNIEDVQSHKANNARLHLNMYENVVEDLKNGITIIDAIMEECNHQCYEDENGNRPCDNGVLCDMCRR